MTELVGLPAAQALSRLPEGALRAAHTLVVNGPDGGRTEAQLGLDATVRSVHSFPPEVVQEHGDAGQRYQLPDAVAMVLRRYSGVEPAPASRAVPEILTAGGVRAVSLWTRFEPDGGQLRAYTLVEGGLVLLRLAPDGTLAGVGMQNGLLGYLAMDREDRERPQLPERHPEPVHAQTLGAALAHARAARAGVLALRLTDRDPGRVSLVCEVPQALRAPWVPHLGGVGRPPGTETVRELRTYRLADPWSLDPAGLGPDDAELLSPTALSGLGGVLVHPGRPTPPSDLDRRVARACFSALLDRILPGDAALPDDAFSSRLAQLRRQRQPEHFTRAGLEALVARLGPEPQRPEPAGLLPQARASLERALVPGRPLMAAIQAGVQGALLAASPIVQLRTGPDRWRRFFAITGTGTPVAVTVLAVDTDDRDGILGHALLEGGAAQAQLDALAPLVATPETARQAAMLSAAALEESLAAQLHAGMADPEALAASLRPRAGDAHKVFRADVADAIDAAQTESWTHGKVRIRVQSHQTDIRVNVAPAGMLAQDSPLVRPFPQAYRALSEYLEPSRVWATWVHHAPGVAQGMRYDGLVWVDDHWAWFPKPWRALKHR